MLPTITLIVLMFILIFLGIPICFAFACVSIAGVFMIGSNPLNIVPQGLFGGMNSFTILAIPFFVFAGELMNYGGITKRLVRFSTLIIGRMRASLAQVNILASMFFGGITGSAVADTSSIGGMLIPAMVEEGYDPDFSVAVTASSSVIGPIIPPSIVMVVYGATVNTSIGAMFMGGIIPGILVGLGLMAVVACMSRTHNFPRRTEKFSRQEALEISLGAIFPLGMPLIILGGILSGIFTPTEAGAVSAFYSLIVGTFITKGKIFKAIPSMLLKTAKTTAGVLFIMGNAMILSRIFAYLRIQQSLAEFVTTYLNTPILFLIFINILLLFMGMFMEGSATIILLAPILAPIANSLGIHPVQFGLIMCMNAVIGNATPPVGVCLFIGCGIGKINLWQGAKKIFPFILAEITVLLMVSYIPPLTTFLPKMAGLIK